jgi:phage FluMu gp28-like protein
MDVARTGHKSSVVELDKDSGGGLWLLAENIRSERGMPWPAQEAWAGEVVARCGTLALDATGIGTQFGERLVEQHGSSVIPLKFDIAVKERIFSGLRLALERQGSNGKPRLRLPRDNPQLRRAVLSLRRRYSTAGNTIYDLDESAAGHGDEAVALALAVEACGGLVRDQLPLTSSPVLTATRGEQAKHIRPKRGAAFQ